MSKDIVPEWLRLRRELRAIARGLWEALWHLEDRIEKLEDKEKGQND